MRLLIAGGEGQLGKEFSELNTADCHIINCSRLTMDITDIDSIRHAIQHHQPQALINAAAYTAVDRAEQEVDTAFAINATGVANLARVAQEYDIPFLHVSTDYVFAGDKPRGSLYRETDLCEPRTVYGRSKLEGERLALAHCTNTCIIRTSWVFGRYGNNFPKTMLRLGQERDELRVVADQWGGPTHAADIAKLLIVATKARLDGTLMPGIYHYSGAPLCTWFDFANAIFLHAKDKGLRIPHVIPITSQEYPVAAERPSNSAMDCSKLTNALGIALPDWHIGIECLLTAR